jgi:hypothetical protein
VIIAGTGYEAGSELNTVTGILRESRYNLNVKYLSLEGLSKGFLKKNGGKLE